MFAGRWNGWLGSLVMSEKDKRPSIPLIASVSGGKDSAAMCLHLREMGIEYRAVFMDTGWESNVTYDYLRGPLDEKIGPIEWIKPPLSMPALILKKGMFPGRLRRYCTQELKIFPYIAWVRKHYADQVVVNAVGIRAGESAARALLAVTAPMRETANKIIVWRPLLSWSTDDVIEVHKRHDLKPNPLYLSGAARVGCWPCIFARKKELRFVADNDPKRIEQIRLLEGLVSDAAKERYAKKGETLESNSAPTFFGRGDPTLTIDEMVDWSRTAYGGKQYELFSDSDREGCMRWGMCESD